jgi:AraC-like DNA-binding protein
MDEQSIRELTMPATYGWHLTRRFPPDALFAGTGLSAADVADPERRITVAQALRYIDNAIGLAGRPDWYHEWASALSDHFHGPLSLALMSAPTLGEGLEAFFRYFPGRIPYLHLHGRMDGELFRAELRPLIDLGPSRPLLIETPLIILLQYVGSVYPVNLAEAAALLDYPPTSYADAYGLAFKCPVHFGAAASALVIPERWRAIANVGYVESNWIYALQQCETSMGLSGDRSTLGRVRDCLASALADNSRSRAMPTLDEVAAKLLMSPRTVMRRLRAMGTSYQETMDEILKARARELLSNHRLKVKEVAAALGFRDPANFGSAFKRWFAVSPRTYRQRLGNAGRRTPLS